MGDPFRVVNIPYLLSAGRTDLRLLKGDAFSVYKSGFFDQALSSEQIVCNALLLSAKTTKKNVFLPKYLDVWNKYITFAA